MILKAMLQDLERDGKAVALMNLQDAERLGVQGLDRITMKNDDGEQTAIVDTSPDLIPSGHIGVCKKIWASLNLRTDLDVEVEIAPIPASVFFIRNKLNRRKLVYDEILEIV